MQLASPAFPDGGTIPPDHTADGKDISPALEWTGVPEGTRSFALIVDDPDAPDPAAPKRVFVHWVVTDIPATVHALHAGEVPDEAMEGRNDWEHDHWDGPAPPIGRHRYVFKLYALDTRLDLSRPAKRDVEKAMKGHILAEARLIGTYERTTSRHA
jgi:Raf kinase inhibitor-like YbhB/YbcL family protein